MTRWLLLLLGLAMGALGLKALLGPADETLGPPMDDIGREDSARLERILEAAEREGRAP